MFDEQAAQRKRDPIALVGWNAPFPEDLRHDAEHCAAVEALPTTFQGMTREATYAEGGVHCSKSFKQIAPQSLAILNILTRHFAAATASPTARCRPSISIPK